ncbi:hypothetical protein D1AOALGA4SA_3999 [Olavius algarvensis Delta 1 endosymbiont]|nr:hypothetical protein D1AOALGA4SA_3999 [Olavius algarvensis Delta 1 endosymbiont]
MPIPRSPWSELTLSATSFLLGFNFEPVRFDCLYAGGDLTLDGAINVERLVVC